MDLPGSVSLRRLSLMAVVVLALVIATGATALVLMADTIGTSIDTIAFRNHGVSAADMLEQRLLHYSRVSNLAAAGMGGAATEREQAREQLEEAIETSAIWIASDTERRIQRRTAESVRAYVRYREELAAAGLPVGDLIELQRSSLEVALANVQSLRAINYRDLEHSQQLVARDAARQRVVAVVAGLVQVLGLGAVLAGLIVYVVRPLTGLHGAIERFSRGEQDARAEERGPTELVVIVRAFNELAGVLVHQRQAQLAHLGGVVHDMRDPLLAMSLAVGRLRRDASLADASPAVDALERQMGRLRRMIDDVLEAARIESGVLELRVETVDVGAVVERVVASFQERAPTHEVVAQLPGGLVTLRADPDRLEQVLTNLVGNGVKYSPDGSRVEIRVTEDSDAVALAVVDQGRGIAETDRERIFTPFRRAGGRLDVVPGTGLGLSVVRRIVDAHGGSLEVQSAEGLGSTFTVRLPREALRERAPAQVDLRPRPA